MLPAELESLIEMAFADGVVTEKEREVLSKKAASLGVDPDEFDMVLDAKIHIAEKASTPTQPVINLAQAPPVSNKHGDNKKCPSCGGPVESFSTSCKDCGHSFNNISAVSSAQKLHDQLQEIEKEERNREKRTGFSITSRIDGGASEDQQMEETIKKRKASVVSSFPIPNTKEDILEFLSMAVPEAGKKPNFLMRLTAAGGLHKAWVTKAEQIVMKARFSMKEDKSTLDEINNYAKALGIK